MPMNWKQYQCMVITTLCYLILIKQSLSTYTIFVSFMWVNLECKWCKGWTYVKGWSYKTIYIRIAFSREKKILCNIKVMNFADICFSFDLFQYIFFILSLSYCIHSLYWSHFPFFCPVYWCFHNILCDNNCSRKFTSIE